MAHWFGILAAYAERRGMRVETVQRFEPEAGYGLVWRVTAWMPAPDGRRYTCYGASVSQVARRIKRVMGEVQP